MKNPATHNSVAHNASQNSTGQIGQEILSIFLYLILN